MERKQGRGETSGPFCLGAPHLRLGDDDGHATIEKAASPKGCGLSGTGFAEKAKRAYFFAASAAFAAASAAASTALPAASVALAAASVAVSAAFTAASAALSAPSTASAAIVSAALAAASSAFLLQAARLIEAASTSDKAIVFFMGKSLPLGQQSGGQRERLSRPLGPAGPVTSDSFISWQSRFFTESHETAPARPLTQKQQQDRHIDI